MCGSGTIPIEAGLFAGRVAPGRNRSFGFQRWLDFDAGLWDRILADAENGIQKLPVGLITGYDRDHSALTLARRNAAAAGFEGQIHFVHSALDEFEPEGDKGVVIMNPPYGKRLGDVEKLKDLYRQIGDVMKQRCRGWTGFVLTGNMELAKHIGLKASRRFVLFNGPIECRLLRYELY
jgi:putative N6-adenine-specific DNA methylase